MVDPMKQMPLRMNKALWADLNDVIGDVPRERWVRRLVEREIARIKSERAKQQEEDSSGEG